MRSLALAVALAALSSTISSVAGAATLDLSGLGQGHVPGSAASVAGATLRSGGDGGVAGDGFLVGGTGADATICAWSLRAPYEGCTDDLAVDFDGPVSGLSFEVGDVHWGDHAAVYLFGAGGDLLDVVDVGWEFAALDADATSYRVDLAGFGPIASLWFDAYNGTPSAGGRGLAYGAFAFDTLDAFTFDAAPPSLRLAAAPAPAPVPLPASLALALGGFGALGFLRRRRA